MKKLVLVFLLMISITAGLSFASAELCMGDDRYYHDCDDTRYFQKSNEHYYSYGNYYPVRDSYYREFYRPRYYNEKIYYKDVEEYKRTTEYKYENRYGFEKYKTTLSEKNEVEVSYKLPYRYYDSYNLYRGYY